MTAEPPLRRTARIDDLAMSIAELVGSITPASPLARDPQLHRELRIRTIHSSLLIEGNQLDLEAATATFDGKRVLGPPNDILEVRNAKAAYAALDALDPHSVDDLLEAHRLMTTGLIPDAGRFRSTNTGVFGPDGLIHTGTPARFVPTAIGELLDWVASTDLHPLIASSVLHYEFEFIHPFSDGNGRVGRLWHTLLLVHWRPVLAWLPTETLILERQAEYYEAFRRSNSAGSSEAFVEFMLQAIHDALVPFAVAPVASVVSMPDEAALVYLTANPRATLDDLAAHLSLSKRSVERLSAELRASGRLVREGSPRAGAWRVVDSPARE